MFLTFIVLVAIGSASLGLIFIFKNKKTPNFISKSNGTINFFNWLLISNVLFILFSFLLIFSFRMIVVNSGQAETSSGSMEGYIATESIANQYYFYENLIHLIFIIIGVSLLLIGIKIKSNSEIKQQDKRNKVGLETLIIVGAVLASFVSLILLFSLSLLTVAYQIN